MKHVGLVREHRDRALARGEDVAFVVPSVDRLRWQRIASDASTAELVQDVPTPSLAEQTLGYGLADVMSSRVAVPFFHLAATTDEQVLLFRRGDRLLRRHPDGRESSFGRAPQGGNREILGFDHTVSPLVGFGLIDGHRKALERDGAK